MAVENLISAQDMEALNRPPLEASTLPPHCYWSPAVHEAEAEHVFRREWICVGRVEDVPEPGDFFTDTVITEPLIVVRDGDGEIRTHLNVCRHRGCQLVEGKGTANAFRCPYHGWMYGLNGELRGTPDFKETRNFDKADFPLHEVRTEIWEGFILVNLDHDAQPFHELASDSIRWGADKYAMGEFVTTHRWQWDLACNWKIYVENAIEEYHVPWVHAETFQPVAPMKGWIEFPDLSDQPWAVMVGQFPGITLSTSGDALLPITPSIAELPPEFDGMPICLYYPGFIVLPMLDSLIYYMVLPTGPETCQLRAALCVPRESAAAHAKGPGSAAYDAVEEYAGNVGPFVDEDNKIAEMQQVGIRSRQANSGRFSKHEGLAWQFDTWVARRAYGGDGAPANGNGNGNGTEG